VTGEEQPQAEWIVCDTGIVSLLMLAESEPAVIAHWPARDRARLDTARLAITVFVIGEVREGHQRANWGARRLAEANTVLSRYLLLPLDFDVIDEYVDIRGRFHSQLGDNDMWIAATAKSRGFALATCDTDFCRFKGELDLLYLPRDVNSATECP
jgi:predicted nucleic acid-binding protein